MTETTLLWKNWSGRSYIPGRAGKFAPSICALGDCLEPSAWKIWRIDHHTEVCAAHAEMLEAYGYEKAGPT